MSDAIVAPNVRDLDELARDLGAWMHRRMPDAEALVITNVSYPRGAGQSHETILFDAAWREGGAGHTQGFVVRIKPSSFTVFPDNLVDQQFQIMQALHESGLVRVARTLWFEENPAVLGAPFFLMEKKLAVFQYQSRPTVIAGSLPRHPRRSVAACGKAGFGSLPRSSWSPWTRFAS